MLSTATWVEFSAEGHDIIGAKPGNGRGRDRRDLIHRQAGNLLGRQAPDLSRSQRGDLGRGQRRACEIATDPALHRTLKDHLAGEAWQRTLSDAEWFTRRLEAALFSVLRRPK